METERYGVEMQPTEARDWGRLEYQTELLERIETAISELDEKDASGHVYWNKFKEMVTNLKP